MLTTTAAAAPLPSSPRAEVCVAGRVQKKKRKLVKMWVGDTATVVGGFRSWVFEICDVILAIQKPRLNVDMISFEQKYRLFHMLPQ